VAISQADFIPLIQPPGSLEGVPSKLGMDSLAKLGLGGKSVMVPLGLGLGLVHPQQEQVPALISG
jgi:hypothetical protein